jgi:hypothetical protein
MLVAPASSPAPPKAPELRGRERPQERTGPARDSLRKGEQAGGALFQLEDGSLNSGDQPAHRQTEARLVTYNGNGIMLNLLRQPVRQSLRALTGGERWYNDWLPFIVGGAQDFCRFPRPGEGARRQHIERVYDGAQPLGGLLHLPLALARQGALGVVSSRPRCGIFGDRMTDHEEVHAIE